MIVAQLVRAPVCGSGGRRFETGLSPHLKDKSKAYPFFIYIFLLYQLSLPLNYKYLYNSLILIKDFISFGFQARSIDTADSPYLYSFILHILRDKPTDEELIKWARVEALRSQLEGDKSLITKTDLGAGSKVNEIARQKIGDIARSSVSNATKCKILYNTAKHYNAKSVLELGSSLGISSAYLSIVDTVQHIVSVEGDPEIYKIAQDHKLSDKISFVNQHFDSAIDSQHGRFDMIIIDGDHQYASTLRYMDKCKKLLCKNGVLVFDDIYWSEGMKQAWNEIKADDRFNLYIDLFYFGIVTYDPAIKEKIDAKLLPLRRRWQIGLFR